MRLLFLSTILFAVSVPLSAADSGIGIADVFDPESGRRPVIGEWVEYLVCHPVDPLENSLVPNPIPPPPETDAGTAQPVVVDNSVIFPPAAEPAASWRALPLRLVFTGQEDDGYRVVMTFAGETGERLLPFRAPAAEENRTFRYKEPQPEPRAARHMVGDLEYEVSVTERRGESHGFIRYVHRDLPFGIARFATADVDIILVGMGDGTPPAFPLTPGAPPRPSPGALYGKD